MKSYVKDHYRLRQLTANDWLAYKDIRLQAVKTNPETFGTHFDAELTYGAQHWKAMLTDPSRAYFGLFNDDVLVGMSGVIVDPRADYRCILVSSFIMPMHRRKGLSNMFFEARLDWAATHDMTQIIVSHRNSNIASRAAIIKAGFDQTHSEEKKWPDGVIADEYFYVLRLEPPAP